MDQTPQPGQRRRKKQTALIRRQDRESNSSGGDQPEDADPHVSLPRNIPSIALPLSSILCLFLFFFFPPSKIPLCRGPASQHERCSLLAKQPGFSYAWREPLWTKWSHGEAGDGVGQPRAPQGYGSDHPSFGSLGMGVTFSHAEEDLLSSLLLKQKQNAFVPSEKKGFTNLKAMSPKCYTLVRHQKENSSEIITNRRTLGCFRPSLELK